jgi:uncharacterized protein (DUF58 family)
VNAARAAVPLTTAGYVVAVLCLAAYVGGWQLGWVELMVVAAGCLLALAIAVPFVIGRIRLDLRRTLAPQRVTAGERAVAVLIVGNNGRAPSRALTIEDRVGPRWQQIEVGGLGAGVSHPYTYELPTQRRGVLTIGPAVIAREDPLRMMRREVRHAGEQQFWVHPRWRPLPPLSVGFAKDLEGPTSDTSPKGDVAFHALREYQLGDDYRHIHWMSTARVNSPMVRHYVDNRRPELLVLLDDRDASLSGDQFEVAMEIAASLAVSSLAQDQPVAVWGTGGPMLGASRPGGREQILDRLAAADPVVTGDPARASMLALRSEPRASALVLVTGPVDVHDLALLAGEVRRKVKVLIVRIWPTGEITPGRIPGASVIDIDSLAGFCRGWEGVAR